MSWHVTANEIDKWSRSHTREAQETLPLLIKKLILASVKPRYINIPSGDSILTGGWDGVIEIKEGNTFIPKGKSVWEFGTNININTKAEDDYKKRTASSSNKEISYVFATLKTWAIKSKFEDEKNKEDKWKEVKGLNSDDLETWLNLTPSVHRWFAKKIGKRSSDSLDVEEAFQQWSYQTKINLKEELVKNSREEEIKKVQNLLLGEPSKIIIVSSCELESYGFILVSLKDNIEYSSRVLIIKNQEAWNETLESDNSLILIYDGFIPNNIGAAIKNGHYVVEAQESINNCDRAHEIIELPKIRKNQKIAILEKMGLSYENAWEIYSDTKGFLHTMVRHPFLEPFEKNEPNWILSYDINILSTILFINSWNRDSVEEVKIIEKLSRFVI